MMSFARCAGADCGSVTMTAARPREKANLEKVLTDRNLLMRAPFFETGIEQLRCRIYYRKRLLNKVKKSRDHAGIPLLLLRLGNTSYFGKSRQVSRACRAFGSESNGLPIFFAAREAVLDPKLPSWLSADCRRDFVPVEFLRLSKDVPQFDFFEGGENAR
jgi:hypothetical protein